MGAGDSVKPIESQFPSLLHVCISVSGMGVAGSTAETGPRQDVGNSLLQGWERGSLRQSRASATMLCVLRWQLLQAAFLHLGS